MHPVDRVVTVYSQQGGAYGRPLVSEFDGRLDCLVGPGVEVDCARVVKGLPDSSDAG